MTSRSRGVSAMSATLYIDSPHTHFTNLDFLTGKVVVKLNSETQISGIQVKLEGESRTRLSGPRHPHHEQSDKKRTEIEVHKVRRLFSFCFLSLISTVAHGRDRSYTRFSISSQHRLSSMRTLRIPFGLLLQGLTSIRFNSK